MNSSTSVIFIEDYVAFGIMLIMWLLLIPVIVFGNLLVVLAVYKNYNVRTPTNYILASMAVSDLVGGVALLLLIFPTSFGTKAWYPKKALWLSAPIYGVCTVALLHVVGLTVDRYIAITKPLRYSSVVTHRRIGYAVACIWIFGIAPVVINGIRLTSKPQEDYVIRGNVVSENTEEASLIAYGMIALMVCSAILVLVIFNIRILRIAMKQSRAIANQRDGLQEQEPVMTKRKLKAARTTAIVVGVFGLIWSPYLAYAILRLTTNMSELMELSLDIYFFTLIAFSFTINPFIHHYGDQEFRKTLTELFRAMLNAWKCKASA